MYEKELQKIGLTENEAYIYTTLLSSDGLSAPEILKKVNFKKESEGLKVSRIKSKNISKLSRQNTYRILDDLILMNLIEKKTNKKNNFLFFPLTPYNLEKRILKEEKRIENSKKTLGNIMNDLESIFSFSSHKPGIQIFDGLEAANKISEDMLTATDTIYTYIDPTKEDSSKILQKRSSYYGKQRKKLGIKKKIIYFKIDSNYELRRNHFPEITESKVMKIKNKERIPIIIHIYNNKVVYINFKDYDHITTFIITDKHIYDIHRKIFEEQ